MDVLSDLIAQEAETPVMLETGGALRFPPQCAVIQPPVCFSVGTQEQSLYDIARQVKAVRVTDRTALFFGKLSHGVLVTGFQGDVVHLLKSQGK
jgi:hypothetical protein